MPFRLLLSLLLAAPGLAAALPWDGTYLLSEGGDCDRVGEEGGALRIADGVLQGVESACRMTEPVDLLDLDATLYTMDCQGEGESWTERAMLMNAAEGDAIYLAWRGYVFRYDRCPAPEDASAETEGDAETETPSGEPEPDAVEETSGEEADAPPGEDGAEAPSEDAPVD